ncbi:MAG: hypothetical protein IKP71_08265 [Candidatus Riflebacteria bacterium]|nr:hypothetical protein [Candidatus Riflebacteria bacterium]
MKHNLYKILITYIFVFVFLALVPPTSLMAQSESYLDTIYRAVNGNNTYSPEDYETDTEIEVMAEAAGVASSSASASDTLVINTDDPNATLTVGSSTPLIKDGKIDINVVLSDMTRILIGMNTGLNINTSSFTIIDMGSATSNTGTNTGTSTGSNTNTGTTTSTTTSTSTNTSTGTTTNTSTDTGANTNTGTSTNPDNGVDTGTNTGTNTPSDDPSLNTGTNTNTTTDSGSNTGTDTGSNPNPFDEDNTVTTTNTTSDTGTSTGTNTNSAEEIDNLKAKISSNYGIPVEDGTSKFTVRQLELMDATFEKMKAANSAAVNDFMKATTKITRDKALPENSVVDTVDDDNKENVAGYVTNGKTEVHILDRAVTLSEKNIKELEDINKCEFSQAQLMKHIEDTYVHTIVHEMTHAFQNSEKAKGNDLIAKWQERFWQNETTIKTDGITPNAYSRTAPYEDMAECVAFYVTGGGVKYKNSDGKEVFRAYDFTASTMDIDRYNWIKENIFNGVEFLDPAGSTVSF